MVTSSQVGTEEELKKAVDDILTRSYPEHRGASHGVTGKGKGSGAGLPPHAASDVNPCMARLGRLGYQLSNAELLRPGEAALQEANVDRQSWIDMAEVGKWGTQYRCSSRAPGILTLPG